MASSYSSYEPEQQTNYYDTDVDAYYTNYDDDNKGSIFGKEEKVIGVIASIIPIILVIIVIAIIIAVVVELKAVENAVSLSGRAKGWYQSAMNKLNEVDTEKIVSRMFPNGVSDVLLTIEEAYSKYSTGGKKTLKKHSKLASNKL